MVAENSVLGSAFTAEVREAWSTLYGVLADTMIGAMDGRSRTAPRSSSTAFASNRT